MDGCTFVWLVVEIAGIILMTILGFVSVKDENKEIMFTDFANFGVCVLIPAVTSVVVSIFFGIDISIIKSTGIFTSILAGITAFMVSEFVLTAAYFLAMFQQFRYYEKKHRRNYLDNHSPQ